MRNNKHSLAWSVAWVTVLVLVLFTPPAQAQIFQVIYNFTGGADGANPAAGLTMDQAGNYYGTATAGGAGFGSVFKLVRRNSAWVLTPLYSFAGGNDGAGPYSRVTIGPDGRLYGTTQEGGGSGKCGGEYPGCGVVFSVTPPPKLPAEILGGWTDNVLYPFTLLGDDGAFPEYADLVFDQAGSLYGTASYGGRGTYGLVYKLTRSGSGWNESVVHFFDGSDGWGPWSGVIFDNAGNLYGVTVAGGDYNYGAIYQLTPSGSGWVEKVLYSLQGGDDGSYPYGGLIFDSSGNLYGTTAGGSTDGGTVFELARLPNGGWTHIVLYRFHQSQYVGGPIATLAMDVFGNLYGTTLYDGAHNFGSVFKLTPSEGGWNYTDLHDFTGGSDGGYGIGCRNFPCGRRKR